MRISDWSSDVCSSDLALQAHAENFSKCRDEGGVVAYRSHACLAGETLVATLDPEPETRAPQREGESARSKTARATSKRSTVRPGRSRVASYQLGRASCRERVCQYV